MDMTLTTEDIVAYQSSTGWSVADAFAVAENPAAASDSDLRIARDVLRRRALGTLARRAAHALADEYAARGEH